MNSINIIAAILTYFYSQRDYFVKLMNKHFDFSDEISGNNFRKSLNIIEKIDNKGNIDNKDNKESFQLKITEKGELKK